MHSNHFQSSCKMSFQAATETDRDHDTIEDILFSWEFEREETDDDLAAMLQNSGAGILGHDNVNVIPESPRAESPAFPESETASLADLMRKYPSFIPADLPRNPRKRTRPICTFINFMGTREPDAFESDKKRTSDLKLNIPAKCKSVPVQLTYIADAPSSQTPPSLKRQRIAMAVVTPVVPKLQKSFPVSPVPSFGPKNGVDASSNSVHLVKS